MNKKRVICALFSLVLGSAACAGNFYMGPSLFVQNVSANHRSNFIGVDPRLSLGYGNLTDDYYFAGEIFAIPSSVNINSTHHHGQPSAKVTRGYGISFLPGITFGDQMIGYARIGIINSKFSGVNLTKTGGQIGAGFQTALTPEWDFRAEYIFTAYKSMAHLGSPKSNEIGVGATYKFGV